MKQYFVKYLPVRGKIKERDFFQYEGKIAQCTAIEKNLVQFLYEGKIGVRANFTNCKKVALFLCTTVIENGDEITYIGKNITHWEKPYTDLNYTFGDKSVCVDKRKLDKTGTIWVKVLGRIPKENIWTKEGDEFNEEDFQLVDVRDGEYDKVGPKIYADIKCKCCGLFPMNQI